MKYTLLISDESVLDIEDASMWYELQRKGLSNDFELCLDAGLFEIQRNPDSYQQKYNEIRIHFIDRFPFGIHYFKEKNVIRVIAIFHTSRNPKSWRDR